MRAVVVFLLSRAAAVRTPPGTKRVLSVLFVAASLAVLFLRPPPALRTAIRQHGAASPAVAAAVAAALIASAGNVLSGGGGFGYLRGDRHRPIAPLGLVIA